MIHIIHASDVSTFPARQLFDLQRTEGKLARRVWTVGFGGWTAHLIPGVWEMKQGTKEESSLSFRNQGAEHVTLFIAMGFRVMREWSSSAAASASDSGMMRW